MEEQIISSLVSGNIIRFRELVSQYMVNNNGIRLINLLKDYLSYVDIFDEIIYYLFDRSDNDFGVWKFIMLLSCACIDYCDVKLLRHMEIVERIITSMKTLKTEHILFLSNNLNILFTNTDNTLYNILEHIFTCCTNDDYYNLVINILEYGNSFGLATNDIGSFIRHIKQHYLDKTLDYSMLNNNIGNNCREFNRLVVFLEILKTEKSDDVCFLFNDIIMHQILLLDDWKTILKIYLSINNVANVVVNGNYNNIVHCLYGIIIGFSNYIENNEDDDILMELYSICDKLLFLFTKNYNLVMIDKCLLRSIYKIMVFNKKNLSETILNNLGTIFDDIKFLSRHDNLH